MTTDKSRKWDIVQGAYFSILCVCVVVGFLIRSHVPLWAKHAAEIGVVVYFTVFFSQLIWAFRTDVWELRWKVLGCILLLAGLLLIIDDGYPVAGPTLLLVCGILLIRFGGRITTR